MVLLRWTHVSRCRNRHQFLSLGFLSNSIIRELERWISSILRGRLIFSAYFLEMAPAALTGIIKLLMIGEITAFFTGTNKVLLSMDTPPAD